MTIDYSNITVVDTYNRNLQLSDIIGINTRDKWVITAEGNLEFTFKKSWMLVQGPDGILERLNLLALLNKQTGKQFEIYTREEYMERMYYTICSIL